MVRKLTPRSSLENLKREAKRWLKALRANDAEARARLERVVPGAPREPTLRDVQHALALEYGHTGWTSLTSALEHDDGDDAALGALLEAASRGDVAQVTELLDAHPTIVSLRGRLRGHDGMRTALHFAVGGSHESVVRLLLDRGANPNVRDEGDNAMPLHFAAEKEHLGMIHALMEHGADPIGAGDYHELDVIGWATCFGTARRDVVDYLLAHGAKHNIHSATATGSVDDIRAVVAARPADVDKPMDRTNHRRAPLHLAIVKKQEASLATLLELGANTGVTDAAGLTPLDQAALNGDAAIVRRLLERGATLTFPAAIALGRDDERVVRENPGALGSDGRWRALILRAAEQSPASVLEALIRHGASVAVQDDAETAVDHTPGYTPLHAAAFHGNIDAVKVLLAHGASVVARDDKYRGTPAGWADYSGHREARDLILRGRIDMFDAIAYDRTDRLKEIFDRNPILLNEPIGKTFVGASRDDESTKPWWTPLAFAVVNGKRDAVETLLDMGARTGIKEPEGRSLRDIALQQNRDDIVRLLDQYAAAAAPPDAKQTREYLVARFLTNACPDHHVRGGWSHRVAQDTAMRLLEHHPGIAHDSIYTAVVCGDLEQVQRILTARPMAAREKGGPKGSASAADQQFIVEPGTERPPKWEPLLYLCFTRLPIPAVNDNAVAIARLLLDHGADANAYFMAGDSRYSPLCGVIGEGEEARQPHPQRDALTRLLLERGANPYDMQLFYNIHFHGRVLWYLELIYEQTGRTSDWGDPNWPMIGMGGYGEGARFLLTTAVEQNDVELATWLLSHGANPNAPPPARSKLPHASLYEMAVRRGHLGVARELAKFGAKTGTLEADDEQQFVAAALSMNRPEAERLIRRHPEYLKSTRAIFSASEHDHADVVAMLLDLGMSPNVEDKQQQRPLHMAAYANAVRVIQLLIDRGAEIDPVEKNWGNTPIDAAIYSQASQAIEILGRHSRDVWCLTFIGQIDRLRELFATDTRLAKASYEGWTLLMRLPGDERRALDVAKLLVANGADVTSRTQDGLSAADLADKRGLDAVAVFLRGAG